MTIVLEFRFLVGIQLDNKRFILLVVADGVLLGHVGKTEDVCQRLGMEPNCSISGNISHQICLQVSGISGRSKGLACLANILNQSRVAEDVCGRLVVQEDNILHLVSLEELSMHSNPSSNV